jgi:hypothetical protein
VPASADVAGALAVEVAVDVVGQARDRHESTADVFLTETANVTLPPGSWIEAGVACLGDP